MSEAFGVDDWGGQGPVLHFAHANGFPPGAYRKLLAKLTSRAHVVSARSRDLVPGTEPRSLRDWDDLAEDLIASLRARGLKGVVGVGHSVGGVATVLAALKEPSLFERVVLLDPTLLTGLHRLVFTLAGPLGLRGRIPPASLAHRRREHWSSREEAFASYRKKPLFQHFDPDCLQDYVTSGLREAPQGGFQLAIPRQWEARIFETGPRDIWRRLRGLKVPTLVLRGAGSDTLSAQGLERVRRTLPEALTETVPGSHLFPLEEPEACAQHILGFLGASSRNEVLSTARPARPSATATPVPRVTEGMPEHVAVPAGAPPHRASTASTR